MTWRAMAYVVMADTGAYMDAYQHPVRVFLVEADAQAFAAAANAYVRQQPQPPAVPTEARGEAYKLPSFREWQQSHKAYFDTNPYDRQMASDTEYEVKAVPFTEEALPTPPQRADEEAE